jgi:NDP-sugar pyrophosphorylase family protein
MESLKKSFINIIMRIDYCLILAAGFGTRMGKIGEKLPKVLWPVFEKSLLELQVSYARSLGVQNIYINLHYMGEEILSYCKSKSVFEGVKFLWETPQILDIGGAVHNLASLPEIKYKGRLLILNSDQFFYLKKDDLFKISSPYEKSPAILFSHWVNSSLGYNSLNVSPDRFLHNITKNSELTTGQTVETYTGISIVDLSQLKKISGVSKFFESVCPYHEKKIPVILLENVEYWDFGTLDRYWETSLRILQTYKVNSTHPFLRFLVQEKALKTWKINLQNRSYHAQSPQVINLNPDEETNQLGPGIILSGGGAKKVIQPTIWWNELSQEIR